MAMVVSGRRAIRHVGLAKGLMDGLKRLALGFVTRAYIVEDGTILLQTGAGGDKTVVAARDPYCVLTLRVRVDGAANYRKIYGGLSGEPFFSELPFTNGAGSFTGTADIIAVGNHTGMDVRGSGSYIPPETITEGGQSTTTLLKVGMLLGVTNWQTGLNSVIPVAYTVWSNPQGEPIVEIVALGEYAQGMVSAAAKMRVEPTDGTVYDLLYRVDRPETLPTPELIWPPATLNDSRPDLARIGSHLGCYARGSFLFIQTYVNDWRDPTTPPPAPRLPDLIRITEFGAVSASTPLLDLMPSLAAYVSDGRIELGDGCAFCYTGSNHLSCVIDLGGIASLLFISSDSGASWTSVTWPAGSARVFAPLFTFPPLYSMQAGHVEFADTAGYLWTSMNHGANWSATSAFPEEWSGRGPGTATPIAFDAGGNVTRYARLTVKGTDSNTLKLVVNKNLSLADVTQELDLPSGDRTALAGEFVNDPSLCVLGSPAFPVPIMLGHPGVLEHPYV